MARSMCSSNCDMNDPWTLSCYSQMIIFQNDHSRLYLVFEDPLHAQQQVIQSLAHRVELGLEYEYNLLTRRAVVSRPVFLPQATISDPFWDQYHEAPEAMDSLDLALQNIHADTVPTTSQPDCAAAAAFSSEEVTQSGLTSQQESTPFLDLVEAFGLPERHSQVHTQSLVQDDYTHEPKAQQNNTPCDLRIDASLEDGSLQALLAQEAEIQAEIARTRAELARTQAKITQTKAEIASLQLEQTSDTPTIPQSNLFYTSSSSDIPQYSYKPQSRATSRAGSISSVQSNQGRSRVGKIFSRVSSSRSIEGSMYSCFDSKSTDTSISSRRSRQAMDKFAKAAMKAVKAIGACWRCKLLRKQCDDDSPCESCPTSTKKSEWKLLGCRRGTLEENMARVALCSRPHTLQVDMDVKNYVKDYDVSVEVNRLSRLREKRREVVMQDERGAALIGTLDSFLQAVDNTLMDGNCTPFAVSTGNQCSIQLKPLDECVRNIIWELSEFDGLLETFLGGFTIDSVTVLLRSASLYQAKTEGFEGSGTVATGCYVEPIASLDASMSRYIGELSRVFFQKEKMRKVRTWWLSVFYSLCIQNFVRQVLLQLPAGVRRENKSNGAQEYLHLALRLFLAYSRKYDPLSQKSQKDFGTTSMSEEDVLFDNEITVARMAVAYDSWKSVGIKSSKDYLNLLFEDEGQTLQLRDNENSASEAFDKHNQELKELL
ncbi:uncharacterized protein PAC_08042 [Phialocephala subalpina]|uniref:Uncharacterized protein n=1 Tax=Phialocephala subalpina TaxID=576137 RepID=A0A1L7WZH3_9HELO|nr:uncharacterized protein PAC_08042 [Phialocephala subalpina]